MIFMLRLTLLFVLTLAEAANLTALNLNSRAPLNLKQLTLQASPETPNPDVRAGPIVT